MIIVAIAPQMRGFFCATPIRSLLLVVGYSLLFSCGNKTNSPQQEEKIKLANESQAMPLEKKEEPKGAEKIYYDNCKVCHGEDGKRQLAGAKDLSVSTISYEETVKQISEGKNKMPGFKNILSEEQIKEVAKYLDELKK